MQVSMKMAEGGDDYDALLTKMDKLQSAIDAIEGWELDRQLERAMQALRCPPGKLNNNNILCAFQLMMSWYKQVKSCLSTAIGPVSFTKCSLLKVLDGLLTVGKCNESHCERPLRPSSKP